jgi:hypothetical protein
LHNPALFIFLPLSFVQTPRWFASWSFYTHSLSFWYRYLSVFPAVKKVLGLGKRENSSTGEWLQSKSSSKSTVRELITWIPCMYRQTGRYSSHAV